MFMALAWWAGSWVSSGGGCVPGGGLGEAAPMGLGGECGERKREKPGGEGREQHSVL